MKQKFKKLYQNYTKNVKPAGISEKLVRLLDAYKLIAQDRFPSVQGLADKHEVGLRTVYRDLNLINIIDQIEFDKTRGGYKFVSGNRLKELSLSEDELVCLFALGVTVLQLGKPFEDNFKKIVDRMHVSAAHGSVPIVVKIPPAVHSNRGDEYFKTVCTCIVEKRSLQIVYKALYNNEITERRVDPYGLVFYEGAWLMNCYCHLREDIRYFAFDRILDLDETFLPFRPKEDFDLQSQVSRSWGVVSDKEEKITIKFSSHIAEYITRRERWHPSEKRKVLPNGDVQLTLTVAGTDEIKKWIYSWFPCVEVLSPAWLRKTVEKEVACALKMHAAEK